MKYTHGHTHTPLSSIPIAISGGFFPPLIGFKLKLKEEGHDVVKSDHFLHVFAGEMRYYPHVIKAHLLLPHPHSLTT